MSELLLAIDPGLGTTGWCVWRLDEPRPGGYVASGHFHPPGTELPLDHRVLEAFVRLKCALRDEAVDLAEIAVCVVENDDQRPVMRDRKSHIRLFDLCGGFLGWASAQGWDTRFVTSAEWKPARWKNERRLAKRRRGKFDDKAASLAEANVALCIGKQITDHNEADAILIAHWAVSANFVRHILEREGREGLLANAAVEKNSQLCPQWPRLARRG